MSSSAESPSPPPRALVHAAFAASGAAGLVLEIVWSKYLSLLSGNSMEGVATVVAAFLGGLGVGAWIGGRVAERVREPLAVYARLEALVALVALASPFGLDAGRALLSWLHGATGGGTAFLVLRFVVLFAALLPPTIAMGASLPLVASDFARRGAAFGASVGRLYAWNTAGAVAGVVLAAFVLIPWLGLAKTAGVAALLDLAVAGAILVRRPAPPPAAPAAAPVAPSSPGDARLARIFAPLFAVSGFTAILYEVAWTRVLAVPLGGMVYSLAAILAVYLAGLAGGAALGARLLERVPRPVALFAAGQILVAVLVTGGAHLFGWIPERMASVVAYAATSPVKLALSELAIVAVVVLPASLVFGALFPLAAAVHERARGARGSTVGGLYAANTIGSIAGSLATGFLLVPALGCLGAILAAAAANAVIGLVCLAASELPPQRRLAALGGVAAALVVAALVALPVWPAHRMTIGFSRLVREAQRAGPGEGAGVVLSVVDGKEGAEILRSYDEGRVASVAVVESGGDTVLIVNGKSDASIGGGSDMVTQVMLGQLPLLFADRPRDVCIVGYGSGVTTNSVLTHDVARVTTVEIEEAVIRAAPWFRSAAGEPLADARSRLVIDDAGTFLRSGSATYDVIVSEPSNPWLAGVGDLFTSEFYDEAARRLAPGGIFTQWVQCYEISPATQGVILRTLARRFPYGQVFFFRAASDLVIVASPDREVTIDPERIAAVFAAARPKADMARVGMTSPSELLRSYVGSLARLAARAGDGPFNTDDNAWLEHRAPLDIVRGNWRPDFGLPEEIGGDLARSLPKDSEAAVRLCLAGLDHAVERGDAGPASVCALAVERMGRAAAEDVNGRIAALDRNLARFQEAAMMAREATPLLARAAQARDRAALERTLSLLDRATELNPANGQYAWQRGSALVLGGRLDRAIAEFRRAITVLPPTTTFTVRNDLAAASLLAGDVGTCLAQGAELERMKPGAAEAAIWRVRARLARGEGPAARTELERALAADPAHPKLLALARELGGAPSKP